MSWVAVGAAAVGAVGSYMSAQQANKPRNSATSQTSTQVPYMWQNINGPMEDILNMQRQLAERGPAYVGGPGAQPTYGGNAYYGTGPSGGGGTPAAGGGGTATGGGGTAAGGRKPTANWYAGLSKDEQARVNKMSPADLKAYKAGLPAGGSGGTTGGAAGGPPAVNYNDPNSVSAEVARRGLAAGNDPTTQAAQLGVRNILSGQGGADSGGTGFQGYNPVDDFLAQQLMGDVGSRDSADLVRAFLSGNYGQGQGGAGGAGGGGTAAGGGFGGPSAGGYASGVAADQARYNNTTNGNGGVPDTVGGSNSYFAQQIKSLMDQGASDADVQAIIDRANADTQKGMYATLASLDAQSQGAGRYGGDTYAALTGQARSGAAREMATNASATRLQELANRRAMEQALLGQVNTRDISAMQDATNRYGIDASASAAGASAAANQALGMRGQDLQALGMLMQNDQYNVGQLGDLGGQLSGDQLNAINQAQGLAGIGLSGLGAANQAAGNVFGYDASRLAAQTQRGIANAQLNQQAQIYNSQQQQNMIDSYLNVLRGIGGMGGTSTTQGVNVQPGAGVSPIGAGIAGGAAGYFGARGNGY